MLYTRRGDDGTTKTFGAKERISKGSLAAEALGALDELNSFLGLCKARASEFKLSLAAGKKEQTFEAIVHELQENLFIVQAELAGAPKKISMIKVLKLEKMIDEMERQMPPIRSFSIPGATAFSALFDIARTIVRRAERTAIAAEECGEVHISKHTRAYINRLSSMLFALARLTNHKLGCKEQAPKYR